ncbi:MAG: lipopolysaccharide biosynthesis protein [Sphingomonadaceae bacterium]|nr:lipopolysaccharide biosynthesis protein [Sphingomonadaceae bacterium]
MLRDSLLALALRIAGTALWLIFTIILARSLPQAEFGSVMYVLNFLPVLIALATVGLGTAIVRFGSAYWDRGGLADFSRLTNQAYIVSTGGVLIVSIGLLAGWQQGLLPDELPFQLLLLIIPALLASAWMAVNQALLRSTGNIVSALVGFNAIRPVVPLLILLAAAFASLADTTTAFLAIIAGLVAALVYEIWKLRQAGVTMRLDLGAMAKHLKMAAGVWPVELGHMLAPRIGGIVAGSVLGMKAAAIFLVADRVAALPRFAIESIFVAGDPHIARAASEDHDESLQMAAANASLLIFLTASMGCLGAAVVGYPVLLLFGSDYAEAYPLLLILLTGLMSWAVTGPTSSILNMTGNERISGVIAIVCASLMATMSWVLAHRVGVTGVCIAFALVAWLQNCTAMLVIRSRLGISTGIAALRHVSVREAIAGILQRLR